LTWKQQPSQVAFGGAALYFEKKAIFLFFSTMFTVSECDLISNTLTSYDSAPICGRPTLKDAEPFYCPRSKNKFQRLPKMSPKKLPKM
jgi:hypothetical protein